MRLIGFGGMSKETMLAGFELRPADELPSLSAAKDVFVLPEKDALYSSDGKRIETSKRVTVPADMPAADHGRQHVERSYANHCPPTVPIPLDYDVIDKQILFIGASWPHYGHFLTDAMTRLWALDAVSPETRLLFLGRASRDFGDRPYSALVVDALGIKSRLFDVERPTLLRSVLIPEAAMQYQHRIFPVQARPHAETARRVLAGEGPSPFAGKPVYLSRSKLSAGFRQAGEELALEDKLVKLGFIIAYPETMTMREQIDVFNNATLIAGMIGSAFHTEFFSLRGPSLRMVVFGWNPINNRYLMIDSVVGSDVDYVNSTRVMVKAENKRVTSMALNIDMSLAAIEAALLEV